MRIEKFFVFVFCSYYSFSQPTEWMNKLYMEERKINNIIPKKITETKSVVFYSLSTKEKREDIKNLHKNLLNLNVDPVNYLRLDDYLINKSIKKAYVEYFNQREIKHIIFYEKQIDENEKFLIASFNNKTTLIKTNDNIWYNEGKGIFGDVEKTMLKNNFEEGNFLPTPQPEFLEKINADFGKIMFTKNPSLEKENLGVVLFEKIKTKKTPDSEVIKFNNKIDEKNKKLKKLFSTYQFKQEAIEEKEDSRYYFSKGIKYLFKIIFGRKKSLEKVLNIKIESETENDFVYLVLLQHSFSKNIFLNKKQKTYNTWEEAVREFILNK